MGRAHEKWHICKCLVFHAENLLKVYTQKNSGYTKSRRKIRQQKIPKIDSKFLHIELLSREAWASKDTRFLTLSLRSIFSTSMLSVFLWCTSFVRFFHTDLIITSVFGGILLGIGVGIVIKAGGSTGGTDMLALVLHEKLHLPVGPCMFITDSLIILLGAFVFGINKALYAILVVFFISRSVTETTGHFDEYIHKFLFSFFEKIPPLHNA